MRVLFDNSTPRGIAPALVGYEVTEARALGWDKLRNGELLQAAERAGFNVFLTPDQNMEYQQNLEGRKIAIVVLGKGRWTLVEPHLERVAAAVNAAKPGSYVKVDIPHLGPKTVRARLEADYLKKVRQIRSPERTQEQTREPDWDRDKE